MTTTDHKLNLLLENLLIRTPGAAYALLLSRDGLKVSYTRRLTEDRADRLAAIAVGFQSLAHSTSVEFGDGTAGVLQSMTEFHGGLLFIVAAGQKAHLALVTASDADAGTVGHNMNEIGGQIDQYLVVPGQLHQT